MSAGGASFWGPLAVKICCLSTPEEVALAARCGVALFGFVTPPLLGLGVVREDVAAALIREVPTGHSAVLLSGRTTERALAAQVARCRPSHLQLVRPTTPKLRASLRARFPGLRLLQVVHVRGAEAEAEALGAAVDADGLVLDSAGGGQLGATGQTHDWSISARIVAACPVPVLLAGGISARNVAEAHATVRPAGFDLCSSVRVEGRLDAGRLHDLLDAVRGL